MTYFDEYLIKYYLRGVSGIFLQQLIFKPHTLGRMCVHGLGHAPQITDSEALGLSGDWEGEAGDRRACLEKHQAQEIQFLWPFH